MGDPNRHLLAMSVMLMRCADIDATRDLDRVASPWSALDDPGTEPSVGARPSLQARPAA
jgi:hypothetical protein